MVSPKPLSNKKVHFLLFILVFFAFLSLIAISIALYRENRGLKNSNSIEGSDVSLKSKSNTLETPKMNVRSVPSLSGDTSFIYYKNLENRKGRTCRFTVQGNSAYYGVSDAVGRDTVKCDNDMTYLSLDTKMQWLEGEKLLFEFEKGHLEVIDVLNSRKDKDITYDASKLDFIAAEKNLNAFLYEDTTYNGELASSRSFRLLDANGNDLSEPIFLKDWSFNIDLYDAVNNGFVFIERVAGAPNENGDSSVETRIYFLDFDSLEFKEVLYNGPVYGPGRGCGSVLIDSDTVGELKIITGGCLSLDDSHDLKDSVLKIKI